MNNNAFKYLIYFFIIVIGLFGPSKSYPNMFEIKGIIISENHKVKIENGKKLIDYRVRIKNINHRKKNIEPLFITAEISVEHESDIDTILNNRTPCLFNVSKLNMRYIIHNIQPLKVLNLSQKKRNRIRINDNSVYYNKKNNVTIENNKNTTNCMNYGNNGIIIGN